MTDEAKTARSCLVCGMKSDKLQPLYVDRVPDAQPVAWTHRSCLANDDATEGKQYDIRRVLKRSWEARRKRGETA